MPNLVSFQRGNLSSFVFFFCWLRVWTQGLMLAKQLLYHLSHSASPFLCWVLSGSHKLFAPAGVKLWSSWSLPPE
jgi:hypothetical protein